MCFSAYLFLLPPISCIKYTILKPLQKSNSVEINSKFTAKYRPTKYVPFPKCSQPQELSILYVDNFHRPTAADATREQVANVIEDLHICLHKHMCHPFGICGTVSPTGRWANIFTQFTKQPRSQHLFPQAWTLWQIMGKCASNGCESGM
jgi:hypothetical protein